MTEELIGLIRDLGFPIAVSCYLLWQIPKQGGIIERNTEAVTQLKEAISDIKRSS